MAGLIEIQKNELNIHEKIEWQILEKNRITFLCLRSIH